MATYIDPLELPEPMSVEEARQQRLAWQIEAKPLFCELEVDSDGTSIMLPVIQSVALVRSDTCEVLGLVSPSYQVVQPSDFWDMLEGVCQATGGKVVSAGEMDKSRLQYAAVEFGAPYTSLGVEYRKRISLLSGADGKTSLLPIACTTSSETMIVSTSKDKCRFKPVKHSGDIQAKQEQLVSAAVQAVNKVSLHQQRLEEWERRRIKSFTLFRQFIREHVFGLEEDFLDQENSGGIISQFETIEDLCVRRAQKVGCCETNLQNAFLACNFFFDHFLNKSQRAVDALPDDMRLKHRISGPTYDKKVRTFLAFVHQSKGISTT